MSTTLLDLPDIRVTRAEELSQHEQILWTTMHPRVLDTVLIPTSSPEGVRLVMAARHLIGIRSTRVSVRDLADRAGMDKSTVYSALGRQNTVDLVESGLGWEQVDDHGIANTWQLLPSDRQPVAVNLKSDYQVHITMRALDSWFETSHPRWNSKQGGMTSRSYWLLLHLALVQGIGSAEVTIPEITTWLGCGRATAYRVVADVVAHLDDAERTSGGLRVDLALLLGVHAFSGEEPGYYADEAVVAKRNREQACFRNPSLWERSPEREAAKVLILPWMPAEIVEYYLDPDHRRDLIESFRKTLTRDDSWAEGLFDEAA